MKKNIILLGCLIIFVVVIFSVTTKSHGKTLMIRGVQVHVTLATNETSWEKGLSGTSPLGKNNGMFFIFPKEAQYEFWMKDMNYPIDIIWFDSNLKVIFVKEHASPASYPETYKPTVPAKYVLEVSDGFVARHQITEGDIITNVTK